MFNDTATAALPETTGNTGDQSIQVNNIDFPDQICGPEGATAGDITNVQIHSRSSRNPKVMLDCPHTALAMMFSRKMERKNGS